MLKCFPISVWSIFNWQCGHLSCKGGSSSSTSTLGCGVVRTLLVWFRVLIMLSLHSREMDLAGAPCSTSSLLPSISSTTAVSKACSTLLCWEALQPVLRSISLLVLHHTGSLVKDPVPEVAVHPCILHHPSRRSCKSSWSPLRQASIDSEIQAETLAVVGPHHNSG